MIHGFSSYVVLNICSGTEKVKLCEKLPRVYVDDSARRWANVGLMLGQRRRRWPNIKPTLGQRLYHVFTWMIEEVLLFPTFSSLGGKRVHVPVCEVADTPFHTQGDDLLF